jgi:hypothetical protein
MRLSGQINQTNQINEINLIDSGYLKFYLESTLCIFRFVFLNLNPSLNLLPSYAESHGP